jgi:hypothetical protein
MFFFGFGLCSAVHTQAAAPCPDYVYVEKVEILKYNNKRHFSCLESRLLLTRLTGTP